MYPSNALPFAIIPCSNISGILPHQTAMVKESLMGALFRTIFVIVCGSSFELPHPFGKKIKRHYYSSMTEWLPYTLSDIIAQIPFPLIDATYHPLEKLNDPRGILRYTSAL